MGISQLLYSKTMPCRRKNNLSCHIKVQTNDVHYGLRMPIVYQLTPRAVTKLLEIAVARAWYICPTSLLKAATNFGTAACVYVAYTISSVEHSLQLIAEL